MKESSVVRQIMDWLAAERIFAFRLNTAAFKTEGRFFRAHGLGPGVADIFACIPFDLGQPYQKDKLTYPGVIPLWIECKNETGKQSPLQKSFQQYVEGLGHRYVLARSVDDIRALWQERVK